MKNIILLTLFLFTPTLALAIPAGNQGFAALAGVTGGQGGRNIVVTNLNSSGTGSLLAAIEASGPRYITFAPGLHGTIKFTSLADANSDMTIDGSGASITIAGYSLNILHGARNVIIHNLTFANTTPNRNAIIIDYGSRDVWIDHCTFKANSYGGIGQGIAVYARSVAPLLGTGITVSWNHWLAPNKKALLIGANLHGNVLKVSVHHNWFEGVSARSPRVHGPAIVHVWNNYCSNWSEYCVAGSDRSDVLVENNIFEKNGGSAIIANYGGLASHSLNASGNLLLGSPLPAIQTVGTFPRSELNYSYTLEVADSLKQKIKQCAGALRDRSRKRCSRRSHLHGSPHS